MWFFVNSLVTPLFKILRTGLSVVVWKTKKTRIGVFTRATSAPNHAAVLHLRTSNRKLSGMANNVEKNTRAWYWFGRFFHPEGVSLVTSAGYKWILSASILSHRSRDLLKMCCAQTVDPGQSMDCPAQTVDPRFAHTIHGLSQALHDQLKTS